MTDVGPRTFSTSAGISAITVLTDLNNSAPSCATATTSNGGVPLGTVPAMISAALL